MAELLLKVNPGSNYEDGDIICAFNAKAIRCANAQNICNTRLATRNRSGNIILSDVSRDWYENTHQYRFERLNANTVRRYDLFNGGHEQFSDRPNKNGKYIDVREYVRRRKQKPNNKIFGEDGSEIWYGGRIDLSNTKLNLVWNAIETKTLHRETLFTEWPMGRLDVRHHLPVKVNEFDDVTREDLVSLQLLKNGEGKWERKLIGGTLETHIGVSPPLGNDWEQIPWAKRKHRINRDTDLQLTGSDINKVKDINTIFDLRKVREYDRNLVVKEKTG